MSCSRHEGEDEGEEAADKATGQEEQALGGSSDEESVDGVDDPTMREVKWAQLDSSLVSKLVTCGGRAPTATLLLDARDD